MAEASEIPAFVRIVTGYRLWTIKSYARRGPPPEPLVEQWPALARLQPLEVAVVDSVSLAFAAPSERLIWGPAEAFADPPFALDDSAAAFELTAGRAILSLDGESAWAALRAVCPLFLDDAIAPGRCAATLIGQADALLVRPSADDALLIMTDASLTSYVLALLGRAA